MIEILERAIELAGEQAKIINYNVIEVTSKSDFLRDLLEKQVGRIKMSILKDALGEDYEYVKALRTAHPIMLINSGFGPMNKFDFAIKNPS